MQQMSVVRWFVIASLWVAVVLGGQEKSEVAAKSSLAAGAVAVSTFPQIEGVRVCQTYRLRQGTAVKVGAPHPCHEKKRLVQLSENLRGGAYVPQ